MNLSIFVIGLMLSTIGVYCSYRHRQLNRKYRDLLENKTSPHQQSQILKMWSNNDEIGAMIRGMVLFEIGAIIAIAGVLL